MKKRLSSEAKHEDLTQLLKTWGFDPKFFIYSAGGGGTTLFSISYKNEFGCLTNSTGFYTYSEMEIYIQGVGQSKQYFTNV